MPTPRVLRGPDQERVRLIDEVVAQRERLSDEITARIQAEMECYRTLSPDQLVPVMRRKLLEVNLYPEGMEPIHDIRIGERLAEPIGSAL
jgi:hypothetical protein